MVPTNGDGGQDSSVPKIADEEFMQNAPGLLMEPEVVSTNLQTNAINTEQSNQDQATWAKFTDASKERKRKKKFGQIQTERLKSQIAEDWVNRFDRALAEQEATTLTDVMLTWVDDHINIFEVRYHLYSFIFSLKINLDNRTLSKRLMLGGTFKD